MGTVLSRGHKKQRSIKLGACCAHPTRPPESQEETVKRSRRPGGSLKAEAIKARTSEAAATFEGKHRFAKVGMRDAKGR